MSDPQIDAEGRRVLTEVPTEPGFYWWREKPELEWVACLKPDQAGVLGL